MSLQITVSETEANHHFAQYIKKAEHGEEVIITRHGKPVVKIISVPSKSSPNEEAETLDQILSKLPKRKLTKSQVQARRKLLSIMRKGYDLGGLRIDREKLYDEIYKI